MAAPPNRFHQKRLAFLCCSPFPVGAASDWLPFSAMLLMTVAATSSGFCFFFFSFFSHLQYADVKTIICEGDPAEPSVK